MPEHVRSSMISYNTAFLVLIAFGSLVEMDLIGRVTVADLLCLAAFPLLLPKRGGLLLRGTIGKVLILAALWLFGQVMTDLIRHTPFEDWSRGWAKIVVFLVNLSTIVMVTRLQLRRLVLFAIFFALATALKLALGLGELSEINQTLDTAWKFGYGYFAAVLAFVLCARWQQRHRQSRLLDGLPFGVAGIALLLNARSMFALTALAAVIQLATRSSRRLSNLALTGYSALLILAAVLIINLYSFTAEAGLLGEAAQTKFERQAQSSIGFLGGRAEFLASSQAITDSPLIGHGSWAKDQHYVDVMNDRLAELGLPIARRVDGSLLIPTHSHILSAWVDGGVAGGIFWIFVLWLTLKALVVVVRQPPPDAGLLCFLLIGFAWDLVFSPFGLDRRVSDAGLLCVVVAILQGVTVAIPARKSTRNAWLAPVRDRLATASVKGDALAGRKESPYSARYWRATRRRAP